MSEFFPYSFVIDKKERNKRGDLPSKELFISDVEELLQRNLQSPNLLGCKIRGCHSKLGSKKHIDNFVEAELLFHNGYYNKGFAFLTARKIINDLENKHPGLQNVLIVGYESYSELFVCETVSLLEKYPGRILNVKYGIFSSKSTGGPINFADSELSEKVSKANAEGLIAPLEDYLVVIVVPISTTLTTHDKVIEKAKKAMGFENVLNIGLIIIGHDPNDYWEIDRKKRTLSIKKEQEGRFEHLHNENVYYFAQISEEWHDVDKCEKCFPDDDGNTEEVVFGVNRESIVPMLQLDVQSVLPPFDEEQGKNGDENWKRVLRLGPALYHQHIIRSGNHHQYYIDTSEYFWKEKKDIATWLRSNVREKLFPASGSQGIIDERISHLFKNPENVEDVEQIHFIVAPRHFSSAGFVQCVNDIVFEGGARIIYFDVNNDFRGNILAKYSDISSLINNIKRSECKTAIMFHFVDDTIYSGDTYHRCRSIIHSLTNVEKLSNTCIIDVFTSIIVLMGRNSKKSVSSLIENTDRFLEYVHLSISPLRSFEDACPLCKVRDDNKIILKKYTATNEMATALSSFAERHEIAFFTDAKPKKKDDEIALEHIYRMAYSHMLNELFSGNLNIKKIKFKAEDGKWSKEKKLRVDSQNSEDIYRCLEALYLNERYDFEVTDVTFEQPKTSCHCYYPEDLNKALKNIARDGGKENEFEIYRKIALIKVISRPFFTYQLRFKQAAFKFCLNELVQQLEPNGKRESGICRALLNALSDMNANYIIRAEVLFRLSEVATDNCDNHCNFLLKKEHIFEAVKRMMILSDDDLKPLALERVLTEDARIPFVDRLQFYIENTKVLRDGFADLVSHDDIEIDSDLLDRDGKRPYYLSNFYEFFEINHYRCPSVNQRAYGPYVELFKKLTDLDLSENIPVSFEEMNDYVYEFLNSIELYENISIFIKDPSTAQSPYGIYDRYFVLKGNKLNELIYFGGTHPRSSSIVDEISSLSDSNRDVINCAETVWIDESRQSIIIKIDSDSCINGKNGCMNAVSQAEQSIFIYLKSNTPHVDVYHFFFIRMLLLLRNEMAKIVNATNIASIIEKERNKLIAGSISIPKSTGHTDQNLDLILIKWANVHLSSKQRAGDKQVKSLFVQNLLRVSNERIAETYRKLVNSSPPDAYDYRSLLIDNEYLSGILREYCFSSAPNKNNKWHFDFDFDPENGSPFSVHVGVENLNVESFDLSIKDKDSEIPAIIWLVFLFVGNAIKHSRKKSIEKCSIDIKLDKEDWIIHNRYDDKNGSICTWSNVNEIEKKLRVPPLFQGEKPSITLWTLNQTLQKKFGVGDYIKIEENIESDKKEFVLRLKLMKKVEQRRCG